MLSIVKVLREILAELVKIANNTAPAAAAGGTQSADAGTRKSTTSSK